MEPKREQHDVGVIVGRFQVPELHEAHIDLIQSVCERHGKVVIFLGLSPLRVTRENPLDFESRKQMILESFPHVTVLYINDVRSDEVWSARLDRLIADVTTPAQSVVFYGGRDSFIERYSGKHPTLELMQEQYVSGSVIRKAIAAASPEASVDFRRGVVWAAYGQYPKCFATVDVAVLDSDESPPTRLLLARKPGERLFRFIGGFSDPASATYEADARREVDEEAHIAITDPQYVGSYLVDDWRYRAEVDKIKTLFFVARRLSGSPRPDDDIEELRWFELWNTRPDELVPDHRRMLEDLKKRLKGTHA